MPVVPAPAGWSILFDSERFVVCAIEYTPRLGRSVYERSTHGFEIVDKHAEREVFLIDSNADAFKFQMEAWKAVVPSEEEVDAVLGCWTFLANLPITAH